ncbi:hypothetical protein C8R44DRAFT_808296 [Mycena epipterygia]|nr:hypothetical protein C8R44DRAFT_808296 [Mycena epipterygia]
MPATSSSQLALPPGCSSSDFPGPSQAGTPSTTFSGCTAGNASVLIGCCISVGGTPSFVNHTCGCPYDAVFFGAAYATFASCVSGNDTNGECGVATATNAAAGPLKPHFRWNGAVAFVLGVGLLISAGGL